MTAPPDATELATVQLCSDCEKDYPPAGCHFRRATAYDRIEALESRLESAEAALREPTRDRMMTASIDYFAKFAAQRKESGDV
jgi:hypothetical protein